MHQYANGTNCVMFTGGGLQHGCFLRVCHAGLHSDHLQHHDSRARLHEILSPPTAFQDLDRAQDREQDNPCRERATTQSSILGSGFGPDE